MESTEEFRERVARMTAEAEARPDLHRLRIVGLALLAYAYLFGVAAALLILTLLWLVAVIRLHNILLVKLGIPLLVIDWIVLRSLWVRVDAPLGRVLLRDEAPELFAEITRVRRALGVRGLHRTIVMNDLNAAVVQHPALGIFGGHRNYLLLGLPLMQGLSREQFVAVLAHEFGHLSGNHGRFGTWIYRVRATWSGILDSLSEQGSGTGLVRSFFEWFAPRFSAATFVLARQQEYEADRCAADLTDARTAAATLVRLRLVARHLDEEFWPGVERRVAERMRPPPGLLAEQARMVMRGPGAEPARRWAGEALLAPTDVGDTHPSLADRLRSLEVSGLAATEAAAKPLDRSAADELLGGALATLRDELDEAWRDAASEAWRHNHEVLAHGARQLAELRSREAAGELVDEAARWNILRKTLEIEGPAAALPLLENFVAEHPAHAMALWTRGQLALDRGDESGLASIEAAVAIDDRATAAASELLYTWLHQRGRVAEALAWQARGERFQQELALAQEERASVDGGSLFEPCGLAEELLESLRAGLRDKPLVEKAWLVRRQVEHRSHVPSYVLLVWPVQKFAWNVQKKRAELLEDLANTLPLPEGTLLFLQSGDEKALERRLRESAGDPVYTA
jgi:Zn-dependent protease with chaperone function